MVQREAEGAGGSAGVCEDAAECADREDRTGESSGDHLDTDQKAGSDHPAVAVRTSRTKSYMLVAEGFDHFTTDELLANPSKWEVGKPDPQRTE